MQEMPRITGFAGFSVSRFGVAGDSTRRIVQPDQINNVLFEILLDSTLVTRKLS
jgi:hypothetical protein